MLEKVNPVALARAITQVEVVYGPYGCRQSAGDEVAAVGDCKAVVEAPVVLLPVHFAPIWHIKQHRHF